MKDFFYEQRPLIYIVLAFYSLVVSHNSMLMVASGSMMLIAGTATLKMRSRYRREMASFDPVFRRIGQ